MNRIQIEHRLESLLRLINCYKEIIDSYVLDFYVSGHWKKLPLSWQLCFQSVETVKLKELLDAHCPVAVVWPLSLLVLRSLTSELCASRIPIEERSCDSKFGSNPKIEDLFKKMVKLKKLHEISIMAKICSENARKCGTNFIVDFGAGLGHLARRLTYGYGMKVCCIEMQDELNQQAKILDDDFEKRGMKYTNESYFAKCSKPVHLTMKLTKHTKPESFIASVLEGFNLGVDEDFTFGIVGLHPCGDLSAILLNLFLQTSGAKYLCIVGCCYMKLTVDSVLSAENGYPLSEFLRNRKKPSFSLSYEARENACHANENYFQKIQSGDYNSLQIHCFRAVAERVITRYNPSMRHIGLKSLKHVPGLLFREYFERATKDLNITVNSVDLNSSEIQTELGLWTNVVGYYIVRLMFAPFVESVLLYDRLLHILEEGHTACIRAAFDPLISPRNQILIGVKSSVCANFL